MQTVETRSVASDLGLQNLHMAHKKALGFYGLIIGNDECNSVMIQALVAKLNCMTVFLNTHTLTYAICSTENQGIAV